MDAGMQTAAQPALRDVQDDARAGFIPEVESLRGIAITLVVLFHSTVGQHIIGLRVSPLRAFVLGGHTGVSLFFILSGFLLSRPFLTEAAGGKRVSRLAYCKRRALRILPLYWSAVIAASILCAAQPRDLLHGLPYLVFLNSVPGVVTPLRPYSGVWWSLATEVQFYLVLPSLPFFLASRAKRQLGLAAIAVYLVTYALVAAGVLIAPLAAGVDQLNFSLFGRAPLFIFGIIAAWLYDRYGEVCRRRAMQTWWARVGGTDIILFGIFIALGDLLRRVVMIGYFGAERAWFSWHVIEGALWTSVLLLMLLTPLPSKRLLCNRFWQIIGLLSYSIYLLHFTLIAQLLIPRNRLSPPTIVGWNVPALTMLPIVVALCLGCATVTYWVIERPFLRRKGDVRVWASDRHVPPISGT